MSAKSPTIFHGSPRFHVIRKLGEGGMGAVFLVHDTELDSDVALKVLPKVRAKSLARFKREFRSLANISHPNLVSLYELIGDGDEWYFTMEHVKGCRFNEMPLADTYDSEEKGASTASQEQETRLCVTGDFDDDASRSAVVFSSRRRDWDALRQRYSQLAAGIHALHSYGKVHRDIKPSNVMVRDSGEVVLLDFGLIAEWKPRKPTSETESDASSSWHSDSSDANEGAVGTVRYMSPEQGAGESVTSASDWYSFGVMLHESLVGRPPFSGSTSKVISRKLRKVPPPVASLANGIPKDLATLCDRLLAIDPNDRPKYEQINQVFGQADLVPSQQPTKPRVFVGRSEQHAKLRGAFESMLAGNRVSVVVSGESGFGKTAVVEHFLDQLKFVPSIVIRGRCFEQESVPFKTLDSLIDSLARYLGGRSKLELARLMPRHMTKLARLFPVLGQIVDLQPETASEPSTDREVRRLAFQAFSELLARIGDLQPLVLYIDDIQWGDSDSVEALREVIRPDSPSRVMLIASHRSEYVLPDGYAQLFDLWDGDPQSHAFRMTVGPLSNEESRTAIAGFVGEATLLPDTVDRIVEEADGNPLFLQQLVQYFLEFPSRTSGSGLSLDQVILGRVQSLESREQKLLEMLAVVGKPTPLARLLRCVSELSDPQHVVAKLRSERLLSGSAVQAADTLQVYHDRIRESISASLPAEQKRAYHLSWAKLLLEQPDTDPESLAIHLHGGGDSVSAGAWYAKAAQASAKALAFEHAAGLYQQSLALRSVDIDEEITLREGLAQAYANAGRGKRSAEQYLRVAQLSEPSRAANLQAMAAGQLCISGNIDAGLATFAEVLNSFRLKLPKKRHAILLDLLGQRARLKLRGLRVRQRPESEQDAQQLQRIDSLWGIAAGLSTVNNLTAAALQTRLLRESLDSGDLPRIARSLAWEAFLTSTSGKFFKAEKLLERAKEQAEQSGNQHAIGMCLMVRGLIDFQQAKFLKAVSSLQVAEEHFRDQSLGGWWERSTIRWIQGTCLLHTGDMQRVHEATARDLRDAKDRGDLFSSTNMQAFLIPLLELCKGNVEKARESSELARESWNHEGFHYQHLQSSFVECMIHLYNRQGQDALATIEGFWPEMKAAMVLHNKLVRVMMVDTRATCTLAAADESDQPQMLVRKAEKLAKSLRSEGDPWSRAFAHRIFGGVANARGEIDQAIGHWRNAQRAFEQFDMSLHVASIGLALARVLPDEDAATSTELAIGILDARGVPVTQAYCNCLTWASER